MVTKSTDLTLFIVTEPQSGFHLLRSLLMSSGYVGFVGKFLKELKTTGTDVLDRFDWIRSKHIRNGLWETKVHIDLLHHAIRHLAMRG